MKRFIGTDWVRRLFGSKKKTPRGQVRKLTIEELEARLSPATRIWTGAGADNLWSNPANWAQNVAPRAGDDLVFQGVAVSPGTPQPAVNNFPVNTRFNSITFRGDNFRLSGNQIILGTPGPNTGYLVSNLGAVDNAVNFNILMGGSAGNRQFFTVAEAGAAMTVGGRIFSASPVELTKTGPGTLVLANDNSGYTGTITIVDGPVQIRNANALGTAARPTIVLSTFPARGQLQVADVVGAVAEPLILNGAGPANDGALLNIAGNNVLTGRITLDSDTTVASNAGELLLNGVVADTGSGHDLTKEGPATVVLDPLRTATGNVYRGMTLVNNGILQIRHSRALGAGAPNFALNATVVQSFPNRSGTLQLNYTVDPRRIEPSVIRNAAKQVIGFRVPQELLVLNGPGVQGIHVRPKQPGANGATVFGALHNLAGDNLWSQNIRLWTGDGAAANFDALVWGQPVSVDAATGVLLADAINYSTVGIGAEQGTSIAIEGRIIDDTLTPLPGNLDLTQSQYALIKTRPGRVIFVSANSYRGRTEVLQGFLNIRDSQALGTTGFEQNGTYVFPGGSLELEADRRPDSRPGGISPDGRPHLATDIVFADENLFLMGAGADGNGSIRNVRGVNEIEGTVSLMTRLDRGNLEVGPLGLPTGFSFRDRGASIGVQPDYAPYNDPFNLSQLTISGQLRDGTFRDAPEVLLGRTLVGGTAVSADLFKVGLGELVLSADGIDGNGIQATENTYTGITYIQEGWITARADRALGGDQILTLVPPLGPGTDLNGQDIPYLGATRLPETHVAPGAALHLKRARRNGANINLQETLWLSGQGIAHRFAQLNRQGALLNLSGANTVAGDIQLLARPDQQQVGIGVDLDPLLLGAGVPSELTLIGKVSDTLNSFAVPRSASGAGIAEDRYRLDAGAIQGVLTITYNFFNIPDRLEVFYQGASIFDTGRVSTPTAPVTVNVPFGPGADTFLEIVVNRGSTGDPNTVWEYTALVTPTNRAAGIDKHGHHRLILQGTGEYSGAFNVLEGTVRVQSDTGLGVGYRREPANTQDAAPNTTTVVNGTALELGSYNPALNGGVAGGIQVRDRLELTGIGLAETQRIRVRRTAPKGSFRLTFAGQTTAALPFGATAAQVQVALNSLRNIGAGGTVVTATFDASDGSYYYTITFQKNLVGADRAQITGAGPGVVVTFTTTVVGGTRTLTNLFGDNSARGAVVFNTQIGMDTRTDSRLSLWGNISGPGGVVKSGPGKAVFGGDNTYAGTTFVNSGILNAQSSTAFGLPSSVANKGGVVLTNDAQIEVQNDVTIGGEALQILGNGPNSAPNIQPSWLQQGDGATVGGQTNGSGAVTGRVTSVATDPTDANVIYITAASGGAWKTKDGGLTWQPLIDQVNDPNYQDQTLFAGTVAVAPTDPRVIYVGLGNPNFAVEDYYGRGVLKSTDSGATWTLIQPPGTGFDRQVVSKIVVDPTNADVIYVTVQGPGVNGLDAANPGAMNNGIWRFNTPLPAVPAIFRPAVPGGWVDLTAPLVGNIIFDGLNRFTDLTVINVNPHLSSPVYPFFDGFYPDRPEYRLITFAVSDPPGHDSFSDVANSSNGVYGGFFVDFADLEPGGPGGFLTADQDTGWQTFGFPNGNETILNISTPRNGAITLEGVRPTVAGGPTGRLSEIVRQYATVAFPVNSLREFNGNQDGRLRELQSMTTNYNPDPNTLEWSTPGWGAFGTALPGDIFQGTPQPDRIFYDPVRTNQTGAGWYSGAIGISPIGVPTATAGEDDATRVFVAGVGQPFTPGPFLFNPTNTTWGDVGTQNPAPHVNYHDAAVDAQGRLVVATDGGVWRLSSMLPGGVWENINGSGLNIGEFVGLDVDPFNPNVVVGGLTGNGTVIYNGSSYSRAIDTGHGGQVRIHDNNPNIIYHMRGYELVRSTDRGQTWTVVHRVTQSPGFPNAAIPGPLFGPLIGTITSTVNNQTVTYVVGSALPYQYSEPHIFPYMLPADDEFRFGGSPFSTHHTNYPDYTSSGGFIYVVDPYNPSRILVVQRSVLPGDNAINILQETLFADQAAAAGQPLSVRTIGDPSKWFSDIAPPPTPVHIRSVGISGLEGAPLADPAFPDAQRNGPDSYDPGTIYVMTNYGLFVSLNNGSKWVKRDAGLPISTRTDFFGITGAPYDEYGEIVVDPRNRNVAYITRHVFRNGATDGQIWRTANAGQTWVNVTGDLPDLPAWKVTFNSRNGDLYLGNDNGVYRLTEADLADGLAGGTFTWTRFGEGLPNVQVKQLVFNPLTNTLTAGTFGRGLFTMWLDDNTDDFANNRFNRGAIRSSTGSSVWTGNITMTGTTDIRAERDSQINFISSIVENRPGANYTVNKTGTGRVVLSSSNALGGLVNVLEGTVRVAHPNGLGSATLAGRTVVNPSASLELQTNLAGERVELRGPGQTFNGKDTGALRNVSNNNTFTGQLVLFANSTIGVESGSTLTIGVKAGLPGVGVITQAAANVGYTKTGTGTLVTNTANAYTGDTLINEGQVVVSSARGLGPANSGRTTVKAGAALKLLAPPLAAPDDDGTIKPGAPATAPLTFVGEALFLEGTGIANGGALIVCGAVTWQGPISLVAVPPFQPSASINVFDNRSSLVVVGVVDGTGGLIKVGPGRLTLTRDNTYVGRTVVVAGPLRIQTPLGLGTTAGDTEVRDGGALELVSAAGLTIAGETLRLAGRGPGPAFAGALNNLAGNNVWTGDVILLADTAVGAAAGTTLRLTGTITDTAPSDLTKKGLGQLILDGLGAYNGVTIIAQGDLTVNGTIGNVVLAGGNLRGDGGVGTITASAPNSLVAPGGASPTGVLESNGVTWRSDVRFFVTINGTAPGTGHDKLLVNGSINLAGAQLLGTSGPAIALGDQVNIIETVGGTITGTFAGLANGSFLTLSGRRFRIIYTTNAVVLRRE